MLSGNIFYFEMCKNGKKPFAGKVSTLSPDLLKADWGTPALQNSQANLPRLKHLAARTAQALLTLTSSCVLNYINTLRPVCPGEMLQLNVHLRESPSLGMGPPSKAVGSSSKAGCPQAAPVALPLSSPCVSPRASAAQGSREDPGRTEDPSLHAFSRNSSSGLPLRAGQKSSAATATARVAWWPVRSSKAKIQPLQLLWLNHLLNYTGKCAWNHSLRWFSSPLPETRVNWARGNQSS